MEKNKALEKLLANRKFNQNEDHDFKGYFYPGIKKEEAFGKWKVSLSGNMSYDNGRYSIEEDSLAENDWFLQLLDRYWRDWNEFIPAYSQALTNTGSKEIRQLILP